MLSNFAIIAYGNVGRVTCLITIIFFFSIDIGIYIVGVGVDEGW